MKRKLKLGCKVLSSNFNALKFPYKLTFAITYKCNSKCKHCSIWQKKPQNELTLKEIQKFAEKAKFLSWYNLTGGEPFLRKDIVDIAQAFWENSQDIYLFNTTTNAFNPELIYQKVEEILELKIPKVIVPVSLDGYQELHDKIRGIPGAYERALELYKSLKELSQKNSSFETFFGYTINPFNVGKFKGTYQKVKKGIPSLTLQDFHVNLFHLSPHYYGNLNFPLSVDEYKNQAFQELKVVEKIKPRNFLNPVGFLEHSYLKLAKNFIKTRKTPLPCKAIQSSFYLDSLGNVFPCTIYNKKLGNLRDYNYDVKKILQLKETKKLKEEVRELKCPNCWTPCEAYQIILGNLFSLFRK